MPLSAGCATARDDVFFALRPRRGACVAASSWTCHGANALRKSGVIVANVDFIEFYQSLGVAPGCSVEELKRAYRRRVAELHPDRHTADTPAGAEHLQELTVAYTAATSFARRYGRLPGATHSGARITPLAQNQARGQASIARNEGVRRLVLTLVVLALIAWLVWANTAAQG